MTVLIKSDLSASQLKEVSERILGEGRRVGAVTKKEVVRGKDALALAMQMVNTRRKRSKFNSVKTTVDGITFHSKAEASRWLELRLAEKQGYIRDLKRQVSFDLLAHSPTGPVKIGTYKADYTYTTRTGQQCVEDKKGMRTAHYRRTKKIFEANYGIEILET